MVPLLLYRIATNRLNVKIRIESHQQDSSVRPKQLALTFTRALGCPTTKKARKT